MIVVPKKKHVRIVKEKDYEIEILKDRLNELLLENCDLEKKLKKKDDEIFVLKNMLVREVDKQINRLEHIKRNTKKTRIRNKCQKNIDSCMMKKLTYKNK